MLLGCIADDLTGATDLALMLARGGMRTVQIMGVPGERPDLDAFDAVVVALKSRTIPVRDAIDLSLRSADALLGRGARQLFFKYCSTFDSTDQGNIGPVAEALIARTGGDVAIVCPAFPANRRSVYMGHLFVGDLLLAESPMRDHPLTPMRDSNLVRVMQRQTRLPVGLVPFGAVEQGPAAIGTALTAGAKDGKRFMVVDAITDRHLRDIGTAVAGMPLVTGGSGVAMGLPDNFARQGAGRQALPSHPMTAPEGRAAILAGSCSEATRSQVATAVAAGMPSFRVDPLALARKALTAPEIVAWALGQPATRPVLIYSSDNPTTIAAVHAELGREPASTLVETLFADVAAGLQAHGFTQFIVAGGETAGAVVDALAVRAIEIGPEIAPGVPWTRSLDGRRIALALKSGNFGAPDFFLEAWKTLA